MKLEPEMDQVAHPVCGTELESVTWRAYNIPISPVVKPVAAWADETTPVALDE